MILDSGHMKHNWSEQNGHWWGIPHNWPQVYNYGAKKIPGLAHDYDAQQVQQQWARLVADLR